MAIAKRPTCERATGTIPTAALYTIGESRRGNTVAGANVYGAELSTVLCGAYAPYVVGGFEPARRACPACLPAILDARAQVGIRTITVEVPA